MQNGDLADTIIELEFNIKVVYDTANFKTVPIFVLGETDRGSEGGREEGRIIKLRSCAVWVAAGLRGTHTLQGFFQCDYIRNFALVQELC